MPIRVHIDVNSTSMQQVINRGGVPTGMQPNNNVRKKLREDHSSNTTRLRHALFKSGEC